ncbi:Eukaryotic-type carbonic anhydrase [Paragonimus heterotremus]|uniref:Eukaryotic-type carbonic anhydrase n=1 Tax=Paragonimus heterotremus TaxID=100268 RepID=A0A8J4WRJ9_9TREM|nr:Eukaryotic-type carbonic anhydrase [Paragonimus heterotremus]
MTFDYGEANGPHTWPVKFPAAAGKKQSPINLNTSCVTYDKTLSRLSIDLSCAVPQKISMGPHNFHVHVGGNGVLKSGPLTSEYRLVQFHFHWGSGNTWGSEHLVNGVSSPAELHCVFLNNNYGKNEVALTNPDGFTVVGIFLQIGNQPNSTFEKLVSALSNMRNGDEKTIEPELDLRTLLPNDLSKYYTYPGSLTTPPCSECVTWILLDEPIVVSEDQIDRLRQMHADCTVCGSTDNFRPICPLGSRRVRSSFPCS